MQQQQRTRSRVPTSLSTSGATCTLTPPLTRVRSFDLFPFCVGSTTRALREHPGRKSISCDRLRRLGAATTTTVERHVPRLPPFDIVRQGDLRLRLRVEGLNGFAAMKETMKEMGYDSDAEEEGHGEDNEVANDEYRADAREGHAADGHALAPPASPVLDATHAADLAQAPGELSLGASPPETRALRLMEPRANEAISKSGRSNGGLARGDTSKEPSEPADPPTEPSAEPLTRRGLKEVVRPEPASKPVSRFGLQVGSGSTMWHNIAALVCLCGTVLALAMTGITVLATATPT